VNACQKETLEEARRSEAQETRLGSQAPRHPPQGCVSAPQARSPQGRVGSAQARPAQGRIGASQDREPAPRRPAHAPADDGASALAATLHAGFLAGHGWIGPGR
jgi:hypothetical protein